MSAALGRRRIGIVGYGSIGKYLFECIGKRADMEVVFVWNRTIDKVRDDPTVPPSLILEDLTQFASFTPDLVVEVAHPDVMKEYGAAFLAVCDLMIGSPTALADSAVEATLRDAAMASLHTVYVPTGAFWGAEDIAKMAAAGTLASLSVTMSKHPAHFRLTPPLDAVLNDFVKTSTSGSIVLYEGSVRGLCPLAPNNVNTMACGAIAAPHLGFDGVTGKLIADFSLTNWHIVEIEAKGHPNASGAQLNVKLTRTNPAATAAVTGSATYGSFWSSLIAAKGKAPGLVIC